MKEADIKQAATARWSSPSIDLDKTTFNHPAYNAPCLAQVLLSSLTDDFEFTITNRIDTSLRNDGPYILWMICYNIHRINVAFTESIKTTIHEATLLQFDGDARKYVEHVHNNLHLITHSSTPQTSHNDLLPQILTQLCSSTVPAF
jgi:hypothetical protein